MPSTSMTLGSSPSSSSNSARSVEVHLGITPLNVSAELVIQLGIALPYDVRAGVYLADVHEGSPAFEAGMQRGDIIVAVDEQTITNSGELSRFLFMHGPGTPVQITFYRGSELSNVELTLGE